MISKPANPSSQSRKKLRLLLVQKMPGKADALQDMLDGEFLPTQVATSKDALRLLKRSSFDVVLLSYCGGSPLDASLLAEICLYAPVIAVSGEAEAHPGLFQYGVQDILDAAELSPGRLRKRVEFAVARWKFSGAKHSSDDPIRRASLSERRFRALVEKISDGLSISTPSGHWLYLSPSSETILGYTPGELVAKNRFDLVHPEDTVVMRKAFAEAISNTGPTRPAQYRMKRKDGKWCWLESVFTNLLDDPAVGGIVGNHRDITDRKETEEALAMLANRLQAERSRSRALLEHVPGIVWETWVQPDGVERVNFVSDHIRKLLGYSPAAFAESSLSWLSYVHPDDQERIKHEMAQGVPERESRMHYRFVARDGRTVWVETRFSAIRDYEGEVVGIRGVTVDVSDIKRVERQLRESSEQLRERVKELTALHKTAKLLQRDDLDEQTLLLEIAALLPAAFSYPDAAAARVHFGALAAETPGFKETPWLQSVKYKSGECAGRIDVCYLQEQPSGDHGPFLIEEHAMLESIAEMLCSHLERRRATEALHRSELRNRMLVETSQDTIYTTDQEGTITSLNPAFERETGWKVKDWLGKSFIPLVHPEDVPYAMEVFKAVVEDGEVRRYELRIHTAGGGYVIGEFHVTPYVSEDGVAGELGIVRNVTQRQQEEQRVREQNIELERRVALRTAELEEAMKQLESFSYSVSHDLRAPLRAIEGFSKMLAEECGGKITDAGQHYLGMMRDGVFRMGRLIEDLLTFSRLGRLALEIKPVEPRQVVDRVLRELENDYSGRRVEFHVDDLPPCNADHALLKQVYHNLIDNAVKYTRKCECAKIEIGATIGEHGEPVYYVKDNGAGFDMRYAHKLFGVFQRLHSAAEYEGTGVGLANVQRIIQRHGGSVWAKAAPERGAQFFFTINTTKADGGE